MLTSEVHITWVLPNSEAIEKGNLDLLLASIFGCLMSQTVFIWNLVQITIILQLHLDKFRKRVPLKFEILRF